MQTLQQHLDDLDRMVDSGKAPKAELRSQVSFISREVSALESAYSHLEQEHALLQAEHAKLQTEHAKLQEAHSKINRQGADALQKEAQDYRKLLRSKQLKYDP